jgi:hypothetical protein
MSRTVGERKLDMLALRIRNLIAAREFNTSQANRELQSGGDWQWDHGERDKELARKIEDIEGQVREVLRRLEQLADGKDGGG